MPDIFISYSKEDKLQAVAIATALEKEGFDVWWDIDIPTGQTWDSAIEGAISDSKCVIVLWSKISVNSEWVRIEAAEGKKKNILIPVRIEDVEVPLAFRRRQYTDLIDWSRKRSDHNFKKLIDDINFVIGNSSSSYAETNNTQSPAKSIKTNLKNKFWILPLILIIVLGFSQSDKIIDLFRTTPDPHKKDIAPISFNIENEKLTLIYHSYTLSRKDTFDIDPNKTIKYLKEAIERHYQITVPESFAKKLEENAGNISSVLSADHQLLNAEYQSLKEAGLKPFDIIEFEYQLKEH